MRKKLLISIMVIGLISMVFGLGTTAIYNDSEYSSANVEAGTIDISINDQNPWNKYFEIDISSEEVGWANVSIFNEGTNPSRIYKKINLNGSIIQKVPHALSYIVFDFTCNNDLAVINPEDGDLYQVDREIWGDGSYQASYNVEVPAGKLPPTNMHFKNLSSVKFEANGDGLGEDGFVEKDSFTIILDDKCENVTVFTKAATKIANSTFNSIGTELTDSIGFTVRFDNVTDNGNGTYNHTFYVTSGEIIQGDELGNNIDYSLITEINNDENVIYNQNVTVSDVKGTWMDLGVLDSGEWMDVSQDYHLNISEMNEFQDAILDLKIIFMARQINNPYNESVEFEENYFYDIENSNGTIRINSSQDSNNPINSNGNEPGDDESSNKPNLSSSEERNLDLSSADVKDSVKIDCIINPFDEDLYLDGEVEVGIYGSSNFNSSKIDIDRVKLGTPGVLNDDGGVLTISSDIFFEDINKDGINDAILRFPIEGTGFEDGKNLGKIIGITKENIGYFGSNNVILTSNNE